ncbi:MAG: aminotransferase class III [Omnitrophica WOR_2 bacterium RIFOXYC2_FULL_38_12]|nr:MAG: aminotransferase class III [Omnitrophica WOR_2 bacterium RIFOXYC2_FULL_38_12]
MSYRFSQIPVDVPFVSTKHRTIKTAIPASETLSVLLEQEKYESHSMHGQLPVVWDKAEDFQVYDKCGNCWIDFTSTIFVANAGHSNPRIVDALRKAIDKKLLHTYTYAHEARSLFLKKLIESTPSQFEKAFLLSAGTEATECAVKLMRMHGQEIHPSKVGIVSFEGAMHGRTMAAEMLKGKQGKLTWVGHDDPNIYHLPFPYPWDEKGLSRSECDWEQCFEDNIDKLKSSGLDFENIAGFIIESYLGWGAIFYPKDYIKAIAKFAKKHNCLVTFDEIQGGFGRSGKLFVYEHYNVEPDMLCLGKSLSGSLPLSAVIGSKIIMDLPGIGSMSSTHSANPLCCVAGLANLEAIESENLVEESARKGVILHKRLNELKNKYSNRISWVLGKGLVAGLLFKDPATGKPDVLFPSRVCEKAMQKGLLLVHTGRESIKIGPPLTISDEALVEGLDVLEESIEELS